MASTNLSRLRALARDALKNDKLAKWLHGYGFCNGRLWNCEGAEGGKACIECLTNWLLDGVEVGDFEEADEEYDFEDGATRDARELKDLKRELYADEGEETDYDYDCYTE